MEFEGKDNSPVHQWHSEENHWQVDYGKPYSTVLEGVMIRAIGPP